MEQSKISYMQPFIEQLLLWEPKRSKGGLFQQREFTKTCPHSSIVRTTFDSKTCPHSIRNQHDRHVTLRQKEFAKKTAVQHLHSQKNLSPHAGRRDTPRHWPVAPETPPHAREPEGFPNTGAAARATGTAPSSGRELLNRREESSSRDRDDSWRLHRVTSALVTSKRPNLHRRGATMPCQGFFFFFFRWPLVSSERLVMGPAWAAPSFVVPVASHRSGCTPRREQSQTRTHTQTLRNSPRSRSLNIFRSQKQSVWIEDLSLRRLESRKNTIFPRSRRCPGGKFDQPLFKTAVWAPSVGLSSRKLYNPIFATNHSQMGGVTQPIVKRDQGHHEISESGSLRFQNVPGARRFTPLRPRSLGTWPIRPEDHMDHRDDHGRHRETMRMKGMTTSKQTNWGWGRMKDPRHGCNKKHLRTTLSGDRKRHKHISPPL